MKRVTIVFPDASGTRVGTVRLEHNPNKTIKHYLHEPCMREHTLVARSKKMKIYKDDGTDVRWPYVPKPGEKITLVRVA